MITYFGYKGWAIDLAIPIIVGVANITVMVLTIVSRKRYLKYVIYQLIIFILSMVPLVIMIIHIQNNWIPTVISSSIALFTLILTIILCGRDVMIETARRFHM